MYLHKENFEEVLGNPHLAYSTFFIKLQKFGVPYKELPRFKLGIDQSFNLIAVIEAAEAKQGCVKVIEELKKDERHHRFLEPWEGILAKLESLQGAVT